MAALTTERFHEDRNLGDIRQFPLAAVKCFAGGLAMINAAGFITPAVAEAGNKGVPGVFLRTIDNSGGAAGDLVADVQEGDFLLKAVSISQADVGSEMFALDDQTIDETQLANQPTSGILIKYISTTSGWASVRINHL